MKSRLACGYELPAGQTRNQALSQGFRQLQDQLHTYSSLIHALRCMDSEASSHMLNDLRRGNYDETLLCNDSISEIIPHADRIYPWEESPARKPLQPQSCQTNLPPISNLMPVQSDSSAVRLTSHSTLGMPGHPHQHYPSHDAPARTLTTPCVPHPGLLSTLASARTDAEVSTVPRRGLEDTAGQS